MEFEKLVETRRSVRAYSKTRISEKEIEEIINCARMAPSWKNTQCGRYYVAISDEAIEKVRESLPLFNQKSSENAAYIVSSFKKGISGTLKQDQMAKEGDLWGAYDLGLQNMHVLFKARELGYDTLIMGIRDTEVLRNYFHIPEDEIILPVIAIGKREGDVLTKPRKEVSEILTVK